MINEKPRSVSTGFQIAEELRKFSSYDPMNWKLQLTEFELSEVIRVEVRPIQQGVWRGIPNPFRDFGIRLKSANVFHRKGREEVYGERHFSDVKQRQRMTRTK